MSIYLNHVRHFGLEGTVLTLRSRSQAIAPFFPDNSLDLVFVDGPHQYESVRGDIKAWLPKVKRGAWISGHDYCPAWPGVAQAVHEKFGEGNYLLRENSGCWAKQLPGG